MKTFRDGHSSVPSANFSLVQGMAVEILERAANVLVEVDRLDLASLSREQQLGEEFSFKAAAEPAKKLQTIFLQIHLEWLKFFPEAQLNLIVRCAETFFDLLNKIGAFDPKQENAYANRDKLTERMHNEHQLCFEQLHVLIAYAASQDKYFSAFITNVQSNEQLIRNLQNLHAYETEAQRIIEQVRKTAAEQGVSQEARCFQQESQEHEDRAANWQIATFASAFVLAIYAGGSAFAHKWSLLAPADTYQSFQLGLSKVLVFAVLAYILILSARNFQSHKHNAIVNKHRQNALLTYSTLVEAAGSEERRDINLTYAASCIFSPQETGYAKPSAGGQGELPFNIFQAFPKLGGASQ